LQCLSQPVVVPVILHHHGLHHTWTGGPFQRSRGWHDPSPICIYFVNYLLAASLISKNEATLCCTG
jgi:hypothetical protein